MLAPGAEIGGYRIDRVLGRGGMGVVYEATQLSLGRVVALKVLPAELGEDPAFRERFRREGRTQASVDHPHIVTVHEAGEDEAGFYIAMRLIRGSNLKQLIADAGRLEPERALRLLAQVADALDSAHSAGLIHRDVKPQNVLVDERDYAYLADFGLAMTPELTALTKSGEFVGTLDYVSPEQVRGAPVTAACDVYALAAMTYEALTGEVPFTRESKAALMFAHLSDDPPSASEKVPALPASLDEILGRGMAKDPADRPASATVLVEGAREALGLTGSTPRSPTPVPQAETVAYARPPEPGASVRTRPRGLVPALAAAGAALVAVVGVLAAGGGGDGDGGGREGQTATGTTTTTQETTAAPPSDNVVGSDLPSAGDRTTCTGGSADACTIVQTALPGRNLAVPADGTITRWRVRGAEGRLALAVLRGDRNRTLVALSDFEAVSGPRVQTFRTRLSVREGDLIGLQVQQGTSFASTYHQGARLFRYLPPLTRGDSGTGEETASELALLVNADVDPG